MSEDKKYSQDDIDRVFFYSGEEGSSSIDVFMSIDHEEKTNAIKNHTKNGTFEDLPISQEYSNSLGVMIKQAIGHSERQEKLKNKINEEVERTSSNTDSLEYKVFASLYSLINENPKIFKNIEINGLGELSDDKILSDKQLVEFKIMQTTGFGSVSDESMKTVMSVFGIDNNEEKKEYGGLDIMLKAQETYKEVVLTANRIDPNLVNSEKEPFALNNQLKSVVDAVFLESFLGDKIAGQICSEHSNFPSSDENAPLSLRISEKYINSIPETDSTEKRVSKVFGPFNNLKISHDMVELVAFRTAFNNDLMCKLAGGQEKESNMPINDGAKKILEKINRYIDKNREETHNAETSPKEIISIIMAERSSEALTYKVQSYESFKDQEWNQGNVIEVNRESSLIKNKEREIPKPKSPSPL